MIVLGVNAFHADSAAALVRDGALVAAVEEERFTRVKHWAGFPAQSIGWCLRQAGVTIADVDHVAVNQDDGANLVGRLRFVLSQRPGLDFLMGRLRHRRARAGIAELIARNVPGGEFRGRMHRVEHHLAHLSSAFHVSPFRDAAVLSIDGFGDFASAAWGVGADRDIRVDGRVHFPHSLGLFYQAMTQYLGFPDYGDEYKVMGLAPNGAPRQLNAMRSIVRTFADGRYALDLSYFRHHREPADYRWTNGAPRFGDLFAPALEDLLGPRRLPGDALTERHFDIARSAQAMYEEAFMHLLVSAQRRAGSPRLALAGGCAMNSVANGKIRRMTPFREVYVPPATGDAGGAGGAAFVVWHRLGGARVFTMEHAYWGPSFGGGEIAQALDEYDGALQQAGCHVRHFDDEDALCRAVAAQIAGSAVVGWFQGRADMIAILNDRIKRRESFRPFAPSILAEAVTDWFEDDAAVPFMSQVLPVRRDKRQLIPAVTHVDGSGRPQTVDADANPRFYRLIEAFRDLSGVPMLLNTSFNENEPIVGTPREALDCFLRTRMDVLVVGDTVVERPPPGA